VLKSRTATWTFAALPLTPVIVNSTARPSGSTDGKRWSSQVDRDLSRGLVPPRRVLLVVGTIDHAHTAGVDLLDSAIVTERPTNDRVRRRHDARTRLSSPADDAIVVVPS